MNIIDNINNNKASMYTCPIQDNELLALRNLITKGLGTNEPFHKAVLKKNWVKDSCVYTIFNTFN
tara:strand:- start:36588 stop:36782 length:195 start_codon:yes stop_codon:yes gene_type:complete